MTELHEQMRERLVAYAVGSLGEAEREVVVPHLAACVECTRALDDFDTIAGLLLLPAAVAPPPDAASTLRRRIRLGGQPAPGVRAAPPAHDVADQVSVASSHRRGRIRVPPPLRWAFVAAAFAGLLLWNVRIQTGLNHHQAEIARLARLPGDRVASLSGTAAAPAAAGRLYLAQDDRATLAVTGLPPLPPGRAYQFWFATADKQRRDSAAVFRVNDRGEALVSVAIPGPLERYAEIWVTQEPAGGSELPTAPHFIEGLL